MNEINEYNRRVHENLNLLRRGRFETCMFADECTEPVIQAHSVSRSVLSKLEDNGHVVQAKIRTGHDEVGRSYPNLIFEPTGINRASTGSFVCGTHDATFADIDTVPMDFEDPRVRDLLFFRAIIKEAWQLFKAQFTTMSFERNQPWPTSLPNHPNTRLRALLNAMRRVRPWLETTSGDSADRPVIHVIRRMKTDHPIVAISWVGAPFWAMRRAMPTRPLWPLKNSQSANPAALAMAFTRRAICDSDSPNTFTSPPAPAGRMAFKACMAAGVMATTAPWASASVFERMTVMRPLPSSQRTTSPQVRDEASERLRPASDGATTKGTSNFSRSAVSMPRHRRWGWMAVRQQGIPYFR